jgi:hypothetical protein
MFTREIALLKDAHSARFQLRSSTRLRKAI